MHGGFDWLLPRLSAIVIVFPDLPYEGTSTETAAHEESFTRKEHDLLLSICGENDEAESKVFRIELMHLITSWGENVCGWLHGSAVSEVGLLWKAAGTKHSSVRRIGPLPRVLKN